jgi:hypothetical protein
LGLQLAHQADSIIPMGKCAYCGEEKKMSGEHIFSDTLLRLFDDIAPLTIDEQRGKVHGGDPTVKDICQDCNGGLNDADTAIRAFAESHLRNQKPNTSKPTVESNLIKLWVVKTAANASRANQPHSNWWKTFNPYLRRKSENCDCDQKCPA